jgi:hypothetical protein
MRHIRHVLLSTYKDPFFRARLIHEVDKLILKALEEKCYIVIRAFLHVVDYILREIKPKAKEFGRVIEIFGQHLYVVGYRLYRAFREHPAGGGFDDKRLKYWARRKLDMMKECYNFSQPDNPLEEIVIVLLLILQKFRKITKKRIFERHILTEGAFTALRINFRFQFGVVKEDVEALNVLFKRWIKATKIKSGKASLITRP